MLQGQQLFFQDFRIERLYSYASVECNIVTDVSEQNEDISTSTSPKSRSTLQNLKKMCFICNGKRMSESNTYSEGGIGRFEMGCAKSLAIKIHNQSYWKMD